MMHSITMARLRYQVSVKLKVTERPARTGRNPQTGAAIQIAAKKVIKLVPAKALVDSINS